MLTVADSFGGCSPFGAGVAICGGEEFEDSQHVIVVVKNTIALVPTMNFLNDAKFD